MLDAWLVSLSGSWRSRIREFDQRKKGLVGREVGQGLVLRSVLVLPLEDGMGWA